jgi:hypothetical protein
MLQKSLYLFPLSSLHQAGLIHHYHYFPLPKIPPIHPPHFILNFLILPGFSEVFIVK